MALRAERLARAAAVAIALLLCREGIPAGQAGRSAMRGMVMKVAPSHRSFIVSHDSVPGAMDAMMMSFDVRDPMDLAGVKPGMIVTFTLVVEKEGAYAEHVRIQPYEAVEQDPLAAQRLKLLKQLTGATGSAVRPVAVGQPVPDFTLIDQARHPVTLSAFRGKVVAVTFIYTSCALPQFCFRLANHFGVVQRRFKDRLGRDLILLTVTFDPARDGPDQLAEYATQWNASPETWHFLTGPVPDVKRVCGLFGVDFFPDEGLMNHSSHTALIDRHGRLASNIEGNAFTANQLADLVAILLKE
jgi:protein SCO1/2